MRFLELSTNYIILFFPDEDNRPDNAKKNEHVELNLVDEFGNKFDFDAEVYWREDYKRGYSLDCRTTVNGKPFRMEVSVTGRRSLDGVKMHRMW